MADDEYLQENKASVQHLKSIPSLENFTENDLAELLTVSKIESFKDNDVIIEENSRDSRVFYLIAGKVKVMKNGRELILLRRTGDVFGEMGVISGIGRSASVFAVGQATCLSVNLAHVNHLNETSRLTFKYLIYRSFAEIMANRLKTTTDELIQTKEELEQLKKKSGK
ncbi:MAG: Crp/Fnr family transcriptional regulator [Thermodesulfobacteriota bacterium]